MIESTLKEAESEQPGFVNFEELRKFELFMILSHFPSNFLMVDIEHWYPSNPRCYLSSQSMCLKLSQNMFKGPLFKEIKMIDE